MSTEKLTMAEQVAAKTREAGPDHDPSSLALPLALYRAVTAFGRVAAEELAPVDLSMSQFNVLTVLKRAERPITMGALADSISVRQASLTSVVDSLTKAGFVTRKVNPRDRRSVVVAISKKGDQFMTEFLPGHYDFLQTVFAGIKPRHRQQLLARLDELIDCLEAYPTDTQKAIRSSLSQAAAGQTRP
ncbi:MarR family winged helix-turn-helix transcriptional regulator [Mycolicibacterium rufum]